MKKNTHNGMTIIEMLIAIFIVSVGMLAIIRMFGQTWSLNGYMLEEGQDAIQAAHSVDNIVTKLRRASQSATGAYPLVSGTGTDLVMYIDVNNDGVVERVHYYYDMPDGQIKMGVTEPAGNPASYPNGDQTTTVLVSNVFNTAATPVFYYYNSNYPADTVNNPLAAPVNPVSVSLIKVLLLVNINPVHAPNNIQIESFAELRNINDYQQ